MVSIAFSYDSKPISIRIGSVGPFPRVVDLVAEMERRRDEKESSIRQKFLGRGAYPSKPTARGRNNIFITLTLQIRLR